MAAAQPKRRTVRSTRIGKDLRRYRKEADKTLEHAAAVLECHISRISRIESGELTLKQVELGELFNLYEVSEEDRARLLLLSREKNKENWWEKFGLDPSYADLVSMEDDADYIRTFQTVLIPGLLQTRDYKRAVVRANPALVSDEAMDNLLQVHEERKRVLTRDSPDPVRYWAIIGEGALRTHVGGQRTMKGQLSHLMELTERPNITLQVLPFELGAHAGMSGPFVIFSFSIPGDTGIVFLENLTSSLYLENEEELDNYTLVFDDLRSNALQPARSRDLIAAIADNC